MPKYTLHHAEDRGESETGTSLPPGLIAAGKAVSLASTAVGEAVTLQQFLGEPWARATLLLLSGFFAGVLFGAPSPAKRKITAVPVVRSSLTSNGAEAQGTAIDPAQDSASTPGPGARH